ncbi:MAG: tetratricopeptide repeat protein [Planctomycetota bacterium]|jgi:tetratricopeptide (TPR) repeat protein|nr:tetratricopeptide repeat protein [Planctomycetota bacterium]
MTLALALLVVVQAAPPVQDEKQAAPPPNPNVLVKKGDLKGALAAWRQWAEREPMDARHWLAPVRLLKSKQLINDAVDLCETAVRKLPKDYDIVFEMAMLCRAKGEELAGTKGGGGNAGMYFRDVVRFAGRALALAPNKRRPRALLGMAHLALGDRQAAAREADELVRRFPQHPGGWMLRGDLLYGSYMAKKKLDGTPPNEIAQLVVGVRKAFEAAIKLDAQRPGPWQRLGNVAAWEGQTAHALQLYAEALSRNPDGAVPWAWIEQNASPDQRRKMLASALLRFDKLGTKPKKAKAQLLWQLGLLEFNEGKWREAVKYMTACYLLRNDYVNALFYVGLASFRLGEHEFGLAAFAIFAAKSPDDLARALRDSGKHGNDNAKILAFYADLAHKQNNVPASRDLNHVSAIWHDTAQRWNNYAFLCRETGKYKAAYAAYRRGLDKAPQDPQLLNDCAVILQYHLQVDLDQARKMYENAIAHGKRLLKRKKISNADKARYRQAVTDAKANLQKL